VTSSSRWGRHRLYQPYRQSLKVEHVRQDDARLLHVRPSQDVAPIEIQGTAFRQRQIA